MDDDDEEPIISDAILQAIENAFETELIDLHNQGQGDFADGMNNQDDFDMFRAGYLDKFRGDPQQQNMPPSYQMGFLAGRTMAKGGRRIKKGGASRRPDYHEEKEEYERRRTEPHRLDTEHTREAERLRRQQQEEAEIEFLLEEEMRIQQELEQQMARQQQQDEDVMDEVFGSGRRMKFGFLQRRPNRCQ